MMLLKSAPVRLAALSFLASDFIGLKPLGDWGQAAVARPARRLVSLPFDPPQTEHEQYYSCAIIRAIALAGENRPVTVRLH
jgi:hypothetical protein